MSYDLETLTIRICKWKIQNVLINVVDLHFYNNHVRSGSRIYQCGVCLLSPNIMSETHSETNILPSVCPERTDSTFEEIPVMLFTLRQVR